MTRQRRRVLDSLAGRILAVRVDHPTRVAVDGCSAAGKSTLADELGEAVRRRTARP